METKLKQKALIIFFEDNNEVKTCYSYYKISEGCIIFETTTNKITLPLSRLVKIKEEKEDGS